MASISTPEASPTAPRAPGRASSFPAARRPGRLRCRDHPAGHHVLPQHRDRLPALGRPLEGRPEPRPGPRVRLRPADVRRVRRARQPGQRVQHRRRHRPEPDRVLPGRRQADPVAGLGGPVHPALRLGRLPPGRDLAHGRGHGEQVLRLYMFPGVYHCGGGYGPNVFDLLTPLANWVEAGHSPAGIVAALVSGGTGAAGTGPATGTVELTRPVYPYPEEVRYSGSGDPDAASSYV